MNATEALLKTSYLNSEKRCINFNIYTLNFGHGGSMNGYTAAHIEKHKESLCN